MPSLILYSRNLFTGGIALFPFVIIKSSDKGNKVLVNHEKIHICQQMELLVFPFYIFYLVNYIVNLWIYRNHNLAYRNIIFEKEAFNHEEDFSYIKKRRLFGFLYNISK